VCARLSAAASTDPDGFDDLTTFTWEWSIGGTPQTAAGVDVTVVLPVGIHDVLLRVQDNEGAVDSDSILVTVSMPSVGCPR